MMVRQIVPKAVLLLFRPLHIIDTVGREKEPFRPRGDNLNNRT